MVKAIIMPSPWEKLVEDRITAAIANGELSDVSQGNTKLDLTEYFALPESERMGLTLLKNAGVRPPEVDLLRDIVRLEEAIEATADPSRKSELRHELQTRQVTLALTLERRKQTRNQP